MPPKHGTKAQPRCQFCHKTGHHASTCNDLAQSVLKQLRATCSTSTLCKKLALGSLKLQKALKPLRCGKRTGRRGPGFKGGTARTDEDPVQVAALRLGRNCAKPDVDPWP